jgi:hypothetical protein
MRRFMFRCPVTGYIVQGVADDPKPGDSPHIYQSVQCTACEGMHLVDPSTGEVLTGARKKPSS